MTKKPTYEELEMRVQELEKSDFKLKQTEDALRENEKFLNNVFEAIQDGISVLDTDLNIIKTNRWMKEMYTDLMPLEGKKCYQVYQQRVSPCPWCPTLQTIKTGEKHSEIVPYPSADDTKGWIELFSFPVKDERERVIGVIESVKDITKRKQAEDTLRLSLEKYEKAFNSSPVWVVLSTLRDGRYMEVNEAFLLRMEYKREEVIGKTSIELGTWVNTQDRERLVAQIKNKGGVRNAEVQRRTKSGEIITTLFSAETMYLGDKEMMISVTQDITERKQAEIEIIKYANFTASLLKAIPTPVFYKDKEGRYLGCNRAFTEIMGVTSGEIQGKTVQELWPSEHAEVYHQKDLELMQSPKHQVYEFEVRDKDGNIRPVIFAKDAFRDESGNVAGLLGAFLDITERKKAELTLQRYSHIISSTTDMMSFVDKNYIYQAVNDAYLAAHNKRREEIVGFSVEELMGKEPFNKLVKGYLDRAFRGETIQFQSWFEYTGIGRRFMDVVYHPYKEDQGNISGVVVNVHDLTELKLAEEALRSSHERFLTVLDSIDATIYVADMETYEILFMNKNMIESFGRDMTGEICWDVFRGESEPCHHCTNDQLIDEDGKSTGVCVWQGKNPITEKWYINYDRAIEWTDGRLVRLQIATDITNLKRMEEELRQAQKMEAIGTLAGGIAHDFNNILSPIMMHSEMIMEDLPSGSPLLMNINQIYKAGERAKDLVKQILTFARKKEEDRIPLKTSLIVKEVVKFLRSTIPSTISIQYDLKTERDTTLADPTQMNQIVMNLCTNAAHAMQEKGGVLELRLMDENIGPEEIKQFSGLYAGHYLRLSVSDTGSGIPPEIIDKIFDPYYTTKAPGEGTGLGLAVIHGIVKNYGGDITVESEVGKGTTFHVLLPTIDTEISLTKRSKIEVPKGTERILIVDDESAAINAMQSMLERLGYKVTARTSSIEALEAYRHKPEAFDLVITDMTMPNMTGKELAKELISIRADIPVILCTGYSEQIDEKTAKEMGVRAFIMKPIIIKEMANTIRKVLDKKQQ